MKNNHGYLFSQVCEWASKWIWDSSSPGNGAELISSRCIQECKGDQLKAEIMATRYSSALQKIPGVERAWSNSGLVYVVLESSYLLQLALDNYAMPWRPTKLKQYRFNYGGVDTGEPLNMSSARESVIGDTLARILQYVGHQVWRERTFYDNSPAAKVLGQKVYRRIQLLTLNSGDGLEIMSDKTQEKYVVKLAEDAMKMDVALSDKDKIQDFAIQNLFTDQNELFLRFNVDFNSIYLQSTVLNTGLDVYILNFWKERGHIFISNNNSFFHTLKFDTPEGMALSGTFGSPSYFLGCVGHHVEQLRHGAEHVVCIRGDYQRHAVPYILEGLKTLGLQTNSLSYSFVKGVHLYKQKRTHQKNNELLNELLISMQANTFRLGLLSQAKHNAIYLNDFDWTKKTRKQARSIHVAHRNAQTLLRHHVNGIAAMRAGPVAHAAKPLLLCLLKWPLRIQNAVQELDSYRIYQHALELSSAMHKAQSNIIIDELEGEHFESMLTVWYLAFMQLSETLSLLGLDPHELRT